MMGNGCICTTTTWQKWTIVSIVGNLTIKYLVDVRSHLDALLKQSIDHVALDLTDAVVVDSSGITLISNFNRRLIDKKGGFAVYGPSEDIYQIFTITGLDKSVPIYKSRIAFESCSA